MGTIVLMGGDEFRASCVEMDRELLRRAAHTPARVVVVPTAAAHEQPRLAADNGLRHFAALGAAATAAMVLDRAGAQDAQHAARCAEADLVYLTGGDPWYLLETLRDSALLAAMRRQYAAGGILAGSSAGAMALAAQMRERSQSAWRPALGVAAGLAVLPHHEHARPAEVERLRAALAPQVVLLGVDSATACVGDGGSDWVVLGAGQVTVYGAGQAQRYGSGQKFTLP